MAVKVNIRAIISTQTSGQAPFDGTDATERTIAVYGDLTLTGQYPGAPGDVISFAGIDQIKSSLPPLRVYFSEQPGPNGASGYQFQYNLGSNTVPTLANGTFQILQGAGAGAPNSDVTVQNYSALNAAFQKTVVQFEAIFAKI